MGEISQNSGLCEWNIYRTINIKKLRIVYRFWGLKDIEKRANLPIRYHFIINCSVLVVDTCSRIYAPI